MKLNLFLAITIITVFSQNNFLNAQTVDCASGVTGSDCVNTVFTAIPFLRINPDTRTGAMGDVGIAISPDAGALYHNASKLAFIENKGGVGITYTPWLRKIVPDMFIGYLNGYYKLDELQALGGSLRYFNMGNIQFTNESGGDNGEANPNEFALDVAYARKLSDKFSLGLTLKYIHSNLARGQIVNNQEIGAANAAAADLSGFYNTDINVGGYNSNLGVGFAITNIGNKVSYLDSTDVKDFLPINLGIGAAYDFKFDDYNSLAIAFDINKLMVPTPVNADDDQDGIPNHREEPLLSGMFKSFGDAPGGFSEEMQELMYSIGLEYWYNDIFAFRTGYFHEHALKGNRKYLTMGLGLKYNVFNLNFSYLVPVNGVANHPLENTLRFSLLFDFE